MVVGDEHLQDVTIWDLENWLEDSQKALAKAREVAESIPGLEERVALLEDRLAKRIRDAREQPPGNGDAPRSRLRLEPPFSGGGSIPDNEELKKKWADRLAQQII